jgi:hypothetical protein
VNTKNGRRSVDFSVRKWQKNVLIVVGFVSLKLRFQLGDSPQQVVRVVKIVGGICFGEGRMRDVGWEAHTG